MEPKHPSSKRYPPELKERAVRMVVDLWRQDPGDRSVIGRVARQLGVGPESLRSWVKQAEIDSGHKPGTTTAEARRIAELEREVRDLRQRHLEGGVGFFRDRARRSSQEVVAFIDAHRDRWPWPSPPMSRPAFCLRACLGSVWRSRATRSKTCSLPPSLWLGITHSSSSVWTI